MLYDEKVVMVPTFREDEPTPKDDTVGAEAGRRSLAGVRAPYSLPLKPYGRTKMPQVATASYSDPDWMG